MTRAALAALAWLVALPLHAQPPAAASDDDAPAATVYETATVRARPLDSATATVTVVDRATIAASGAATVMDVLAFVPGLTLVSGATRGGLTTAQIRGGDPNFTRVVIDGVAVNDGTYQVGGVFDLEALPADAVERVEVVRGPLSSHYGSTGLAGVVHLVTRRGEGAPAVTVGAAGGDASFRRALASLGAGGEGGDVYVQALGEGEEERIADERYELVHLQGRGTRRLGAASDLRLAGRLALWEGDDYPDASGGPVFGTGELRRAEHEEAGLGARWVRSGDDRLHRLELTAYRHDLERTSPAIGFAVPASEESTRFVRTRLGAATGRALAVAAGDLELALGADVEREEGENTSLLLLPDFLGGAVAGDYRLARTTAGTYGEALLRRDRLTVELGLRLDVPEDAGTQLSPRLGVAWELEPEAADGGTRLRASVGRAFKLPSFFALASPPALGGNPDLQPETALGGDVGIAHRVPRLDLEVDLTLFAQRYRDLVDFDFATFRHVNRSQVDAHGAELALGWRPAGPWSAGADLTWQEVEDRATGLPLRHRPEWSGALRVARRGADVDLHGDLRFVSSSVDEQIPVPDRQRVDGRALLGLAARWRATARVDLLLRLDNLADERYETMIGFPGAGRAARLHVRLRLAR